MRQFSFNGSDEHGDIDVIYHDDQYLLPVNTFRDILGSAEKETKLESDPVAQKCRVERTLSLPSEKFYQLHPRRLLS